MCGRWISTKLLARLTARTVSLNPPSRPVLVQEFCQRTDWRNRKGELCLSSAQVCLKRLEAQDRVRLPPPEPRAPRTAPRQLRDDGQPLSPLPQLPRSADQIADLRLSLIADADDEHHLLWNRLIRRLHPLGGAPLVGTQLRYLIWAGTEVVGALGFGPSAYYLSCRDCWIGWDRLAREQNLGRVIGLARFLIRPELRCANLASRSYRLALARVRADWQARYGVEPLLVETYVDRNTYTGKSLVAASWLRLGQSQGRGRSSARKTVRPHSVKDVWVWQWDAQARAQLQARHLPPVVPRSVFAADPHADWIAEELDGLDLGHVKLDRRWAQMLRGRWAHPDWSFYTSFDGAAGTKAAYALIENERAQLQFDTLLAPHLNQTRRRMAAEHIVVLAQDTTATSYNTLAATQGLGPIGDGRHPGRGLLLHTLQAYRLDRLPLGCAWAKIWARDKVSDTDQRNAQSIDQKESVRWVEAYHTAATIARQMPRTILIVAGDREADIMDLYDRASVAPPNLFFLVRAQHDRGLVSGDKLRATLARQPVGTPMEVQVPRRKNQPARTATLELRWTQIPLQPPRVGCKNSWGPTTVWALMATEKAPPAGAEPIDWVLLTDWPITSAKRACRLVRWYGLRWGIECWHQVLKGVCRIETRQMKTAEALQRALVLDLIVAWRVLLLCRLGQAHPHLPASVLYRAEEIAILEQLKTKYRLPAHADPVGEAATPSVPSLPADSEPDPICTPDLVDPLAARKSTLTLFQANLLVAMLGGFMARRADGHPGPAQMAQGLMLLDLLVEWERLKRKRVLPRRKAPRKPG